MARLGRSVPNRPTIVRNTLQDPPVLTTPAPLVVSHRGIRRDVPAVATVVRNPVEPAAEPAAEVTSAPVVVVPRTRRPAGSVLVVRASLEDFATPAPIVVVPAGKRALLAPPVVLRAHLADPTPETTPPPVVVAAPVRRRPVPPIVVRAPLEPGETPADPVGAGPRITASTPTGRIVASTPRPYVTATPGGRS